MCPFIRMKLEDIRLSFKTELQSRFGLKDADFPPLLFLSPPAHVSADISIPWPMSAAKKLKVPPLEIAEEAAKILSKTDAVETAAVSPPGFVNATVSTKALSGIFRNILANPKDFAALKPGPAEKILMEFVSANPTGPLHMASGRGATLGDSLVKIFRFLGYSASSEYYVNDSGQRVKLLGQSLKARYEGNEPPEDGYKGDYLRELAKSLPSGLKWKESEFMDFAVNELVKTHKKDMEDFGVHFDSWFFESKLRKGKGMEKALARLKKMGETYEKEGAVWFGNAADSSRKPDKDRVLVKQDGNPTYFLPDIAYHLDKYERGFTKLIDIWGADHHGYVPRMKAAVAALGHPHDSFAVIIHQLVLLKRGKQVVKMSKRTGDFVSLRELMDEVGKDACRFFFALRTPDSHLNFDIDLAKKQSSENPVFYVQYVHARICSIFRQAKERKTAIPSPLFSALENGLLRSRSLSSEEHALLAKIMWFQEMLQTCIRELSPHHLTNYLLELAGLFHPFYDKHRVLDEANPELTGFRLALCAGVRQIISTGLGLIGVSAPESM